MPHEWILDVLHDLRSYSRLNDLPRLGEELDGLIRTAAAEIGAEERGGAARRPPLGLSGRGA